MIPDLPIIERVEAYFGRKELILADKLGFGVHGSVFLAENKIDGRLTAVKAYERKRFYLRERNVYLRLKEYEVTHIRKHMVPQLIDYDDDLLVIEMSVVDRPFVLDFAGAYLDFPPDYSEEILAEWYAQKEDQFGSRWPEVQGILRELETYEIYMADVNPGNIAFAE